jgi:hypothetical protein
MAMNVTTKSLSRNSSAHVPKEHAAITASRHKPFIIGSDREAQHFIAVSSISLNQSTLRNNAVTITGTRCAGKWVVEADGSVRGTGEDVGAWRGGVCKGMDRAFQCVLV